MKLEDQVCSLQLAKKLKELGVKRESLFCWDILSHPPVITKTKTIINEEFRYSAFTVAELGEMLPPDTDSGKSNSGKFTCHTCDSEDGDTWHHRRAEEIVIEFEPHSETEKTEAEARSKMLIHLIEKGIVKP